MATKIYTLKWGMSSPGSDSDELPLLCTASKTVAEFLYPCDYYDPRLFPFRTDSFFAAVQGAKPPLQSRYEKKADRRCLPEARLNQAGQIWITCRGRW